MRALFISIKQTIGNQGRSLTVDEVFGPGTVFPDADSREAAINLAIQKAKNCDEGHGITFIQELGVIATKRELDLSY